MADELSRLVAALLDAKDFEQAATAVLEPMLRHVQESLAGSGSGRGRVLRGIVHLRPGEGYRGLAVMEHGAPTARIPGPWGSGAAASRAAPPLSSATAWRAVTEHRCAVAIDVRLGALQALAQGAPVQPFGLGPEKEPFNSQESRQRFLGRQASHVCVLPLRSSGGAIDGMISLEADCPGALGDEPIWREQAGRLQLLADVAAPYMARLPFRMPGAVDTDELLPVVGASMRELLPILHVFAQQDETLLLSGATGTGKSRLARWCHARSPRKDGPFEKLDLLTVPPDLQMARLFGWQRGAFTGAARETPGHVTLAEHGTLFIDEIDKLSLEAQAGLLELLEENRFRVIGDDSGDQRADVRFIIGTNVDLRAAVREGRFREDLYFRINVLPVAIPLLEQRRDEIPLWARFMAERQHHKRVPEGNVRLSDRAVQRLVACSWPGNLRQLDNIVRRAYTLALAAHEGVPREVVIEDEHVQRALAFDSPTTPLVLEALRAAALAFVEEAQRQAPLDLDLVDGFRGLVLGLAAQQHGVEKAFRLFGREKQVTSRNHQKVLRRELEKVDDLYRALGQQKGSPLSEFVLDPGAPDRT